MCMVKLANGELLLYNPVKLTDHVKEILKSVKGENIHVVIPNSIHVMFYEEYVKEFPNIKVYVSNDVVRSKVLESTKMSPKNIFVLDEENSPWKEIELTKIKGTKALDEIVMYHRSSKLLCVCDSLVNITRESARKNRFGFSLFLLYARIMGHYENFSVLNWMKTQVSDAKQLQDSIDKIHNEYDFNGVFMAHGTTLSPYGELDVHQKFLEEWNKIVPK